MYFPKLPSRNRLVLLLVLFAAGVVIASLADCGHRLDEKGITLTGIATDVAIDGVGWFVVRDPDTQTSFVTRKGDFRIDEKGFLVTVRGFRVQGLVEFDAPKLGDVRIDCATRPVGADPAATVVAFQIRTNGIVWITLSDGTECASSQILLQKIARPENLQRIDPDLFLAEGGDQYLGELGAPGTAGRGYLIGGALLFERLPPFLSPLPDAGASNSLAEGVETATSQPTDLAIHGPGSFLIRDPATSELYATRAGTFLIDSNRFLITYDRKRVQGFSGTNSSGREDIRCDLTGAPPTSDPGATVVYVDFRLSGEVHVGLSDATEFVAARIGLWTFRHPEQLASTGLGQFSGVASAEPVLVENVGRYGRGSSQIEGYALELINVPEDLLAARRHLSFFVQGALKLSRRMTDLALNGAGFFLLRNPCGGAEFATRNGKFRLDAKGYLTSVHGLRVQGFVDAGLAVIGDVRIDRQRLPQSADPSAGVAEFSIDRDGKLWVRLTDGTTFLRGQILLQNFRESFALRPAADGLHRNLAAAGPLALAAPGTRGLGEIHAGAVELPSPRETLTLPSREGNRLVITGEPGSRWTVQASDDLMVWISIGVVANAGFASEFCDRDARLYPQKFYRVLAKYPPRIAPRIVASGTLWPGRTSPPAIIHFPLPPVGLGN